MLVLLFECYSYTAFNSIFVQEYDPTIEDSYRKMVNVEGVSEDGDTLQKTSKNPIKGFLSKFIRKTEQKSVPSPRDDNVENSEQKTNKGISCKKADVNSAIVRLSTLSEPCEEIIPCSRSEINSCSCCSAILTPQSFTRGSISGNSWDCEYCGTVNKIMDAPIISNSASTKNDMSTEVIDFIYGTSQKKIDDEDESLIIFCVDTSGSMCVSNELPSYSVLKLDIRGQDKKMIKLQELNIDGGSQILPSEHRNITYISRIECMQSAIDLQLEELSKQHPNTRVIMVTFNSIVSIIGDGQLSNKFVINSNSDLNSFDNMFHIGQIYDINQIQSIFLSKEQLSNVLFDIEEEGATALGPALALSCGLASHCAKSKIIICTDGMANVGVGSSELSPVEVAQFYDRLSNTAKNQGTSINVIGIEGENCDLATLGRCANETSGTVSIKKPLELRRMMRQIIDNPVIATNAVVRVVTPKALSITKGQDFISSDAKESQLANVFEIGNVTSDSDLTFRLAVEPTLVSTKGKGKHIAFPLQVQISYKRIDGTMGIRTITISTPPVSTNREETEKNVDVSVVALETVHESASFAEKDQYMEARLKLFSAQKLFERCAAEDVQKEEYSTFISETNDFDQELQRCQKRSQKSKNDETADVVFRMKSACLKTFLAGSKKRELVAQRKNHTASSVKEFKKKTQSTNQLSSIPNSDLAQKLLQEQAKREQLQEVIEEKESQSRCLICEEKEIDVVCVPCGHLIMCYQCSNKLTKKECPSCRQKVQTFVKVFKR